MSKRVWDSAFDAAELATQAYAPGYSGAVKVARVAGELAHWGLSKTATMQFMEQNQSALTEPQRRTIWNRPQKFGTYTDHKLVKASTETVEWCYSTFTQFGTTRNISVPAGAGSATIENAYANIVMLNHNTSGATGGTRMPITLFSLTRMPNTDQTAANANYNVDFCYPLVQGTDNVLTWINAGEDSSLRGYNQAGTASNQWSFWNASETDAPQADYAVLLRSKIDLELWGCSQRPITYKIALVQFDDEITPECSSALSAGAFQAQKTYASTTAGWKWWLNFAKRYMWHPLYRGYDAPVTQKMKILTSKVVRLEPSAAAGIDADSRPHCQLEQFTFDFNRLCNFKWDANRGAGTEGNLNDNTFVNGSSVRRCDVDPKARIYLMVCAEAFDVSGVAAGGSVTNSSTVIPAYNFRIINTWKVPSN